MEHLKKHRSKLQYQLRRQHEQRGEHPVSKHASIPQGERTQPDTLAKSLPESVLDKKTQDDQASLSSSLSLSHHEDEQEESLLETTQSSVCVKCEQQDSMVKVKKQCKNCSGVFCESCVSNELPLPSSILPECVCNDCYAFLLQQYASSPT